ncbi:MAG: GtrA family protein [Prevotella sp.]
MSYRDLYIFVFHSSNKKAEVIRYVLVGGLATAIQYVGYLLAVSLCLLSVIVSTVVSYGISFVANFFLSNLFTFQTHPNKKKMFSFMASHMVNLGLQVFLVTMFANIVGKEYALIPAMLICIPVNFLLVRFALTNWRFQSRH